MRPFLVLKSNLVQGILNYAGPVRHSERVERRHALAEAIADSLKCALGSGETREVAACIVNLVREAPKRRLGDIGAGPVFLEKPDEG